MARDKGINEVLADIRDALNRRGAKAVRELGRAFRSVDSFDGKPKVNKQEFVVGMQEFGVNLSQNDAQVLFSYFDRDRNGTISLDEFLLEVRGKANSRVHTQVDKAFMKVDREGNGYVDVNDQRAPFSTHNFTVVVVRNFEGRWLAVKETRKRGWWLPAGLVDLGETYLQAAHRATLEEAGIQVEIKGILRVEHSVYGPTHARMRVVLYAEPTDNEQVPKRVADSESEEARWVTLDELKKLSKATPGLRGPELYEWGSYIEKGGIIAPMPFLCREDEPVPQPSNRLKEAPPSRVLDFGIMIESIERGDEAMLKRCVLAGVNVLQSINDKFWTPLHLACKLNQESCVTVLLLAGADVSSQTHKGKNVLHFAAQSTPAILSNALMCICYLDNRLDIINQQDCGGDTPLHFAAVTFGKSYVWELLSLAGADSSIRNNKGQSAEDLASHSLVLA